MLNNNDIFVAIETRLDSCDIPNVQINGYKLFTKNRTKYKHKSGGVAIYIKDHLSKYVKLIDTEYDNTLWILVDKEVLGFKFLLKALYIPPEKSQYSDIDLEVGGRDY